jgi:hypothetical protein
MTKFRRIINGECSFQMIEQCKIENLKIDFTTVKKEHDGTNPIASAKAEGSSSEETQGLSGS